MGEGKVSKPKTKKACVVYCNKEFGLVDQLQYTLKAREVLRQVVSA